MDNCQAVLCVIWMHGKVPVVSIFASSPWNSELLWLVFSSKVYITLPKKLWRQGGKKAEQRLGRSTNLSSKWASGYSGARTAKGQKVPARNLGIRMAKVLTEGGRHPKGQQTSQNREDSGGQTKTNPVARRRPTKRLIGESKSCCISLSGTSHSNTTK